MTRQRKVFNVIQTSMLDLIFVNVEDMWFESEYISYSDHAILSCGSKQLVKVNGRVQKINYLDWRHFKPERIIDSF